MASLSLAVMVRDDAARLQRCIESVKGSVDEVLVLDTGSKDDTVSVARSAGAQVREIEWPNNFAVALNALLDKVRTDWVLRLDSDEWFEEEGATPVRDLIEDPESCAFFLTRRDIQPHGGFEEISLIRLWRGHELLRYEGIVHENIPLPRFGQAWPEMRIVRSGLWFWHDGYGAGHLDKIRRNAVLLEQEVQANPESAYHQAMLAKAYADLGDSRAEQAIASIIQGSLRDQKPRTPVLSVIFSEYLQRIQGPALQDTETKKVVERAIEWFGNTPQVMVAVANLEMRRGDRQAALEALLKLETMATTGEYDRSLPVNPALFGKPFWKHLDRLADQLGRYDVCRRCEPHL